MVWGLKAAGLSAGGGPAGGAGGAEPGAEEETEDDSDCGDSGAFARVVPVAWPVVGPVPVAVCNGLGASTPAVPVGFVGLSMTIRVGLSG